MRQLFILVIIVFCSGASLRDRHGILTARNEAGSAPVTYLVSQDFETNNIPDGWTAQAGTPVYTYNITPAPLQGTNSLFLDGQAASTSLDSPNFGDQSRVDIYFELSLTNFAGAARECLRFLINGAQPGSTEVTIDQTGDIRFLHGTTTISTTDLILTNGHIRIWLTYIQGTGADGYGSLAWSTNNATKPTSGGKFAENSACNGTAQIDQIRLTTQFSTSGFPAIYDKVRVNNVEIGSDPQ